MTFMFLCVDYKYLRDEQFEERINFVLLNKVIQSSHHFGSLAFINQNIYMDRGSRPLI